MNEAEELEYLRLKKRKAGALARQESAPREAATVQDTRGGLRRAADSVANVVEGVGGAALKLAAPVLKPIGDAYRQVVSAPLAKGIQTAAEPFVEKDDGSVSGVLSRTAKQATALPRGLLAALTQAFSDQREAPSVPEALEYAGVPKTGGLSELIPGAYSDTGAGIQLKRGGALDPTLAEALGFGVESAAGGALTKGIAQGAKGARGLVSRSKKPPGAPAGPGSPPPAGAAPANYQAQAQGLLDEASSAARPKMSAAEIERAAKTLVPDQEVPKYLLTNDPEVTRLASTLIDGPPTLASRAERTKLGKYYEAADDATKRLADRVSSGTKFEVGEAVKRGIRDAIDERFAPAEALYAQVEKQFQNLPLNRLAFKRGIGALRRNPQLKFDPGAMSLIDDFEQQFAKVQNVGDLKGFRTSLYSRFPAGTTSPAQERVINATYRVLTNERDRSIARAELAGKTGRLQTGRFAGPNQKAAPDTLATLREADSLFKSASRQVGEGLGLEATKKGNLRRVAQNFLESTPSEKLVDTLFDQKNVGKLRAVERVFPDQFEVLRERALSELVEKATKGSEVSATALVSKIRQIKSPEVRQLLLRDLEPVFRDVDTVISSFPRNFNPPNTATKIEWLKYLREGLGEEVRDRAAMRQIAKRTAPPKTALGLLRQDARRGLLGTTIERQSGERRRQ